MRIKTSSIAAVVLLLLASVGVRAATHDCAAIQRGIDGLPPEGGRVRLRAGTWICSRPLIIARDNVSLIGAGPATVITLASGANSPVLIVGSAAGVPAAAVRHIAVENLTIVGNRLQQQTECWGGDCSTNPIHNNGIDIRDAADVLVQNVDVSATASGGIVIELNSTRVRIVNVTSSDNAFDGVAAYQTTNSEFSNLNLVGNLSAGLSFDQNFAGNSIANVTITGSGTVGIFMRDSTANIFSGLQISGTAQMGIFVAQVNGATNTGATSNVFSGVSIRNSKLAAVQVNDASCIGNVLSGAALSGNGACVVEATPGLLIQSGVTCR